MTHIKPINGVRRYTLGKLVKHLKERKIQFSRQNVGDTIEISHSSRNGQNRYVYLFDSATALIESKKMTTPELSYRVNWSDDKVKFNLNSHDGVRHMEIERSVSVEKQSLLSRLLSRTKLSDVKRIRTIKDVVPSSPTDRGFIKDEYCMPNARITVINSQLAYNVRTEGRNGQLCRLNLCRHVKDETLQQQILLHRMKR